MSAELGYGIALLLIMSGFLFKLGEWASRKARETVEAKPLIPPPPKPSEEIVRAIKSA